jgi:hypothetical protein
MLRTVLAGNRLTSPPAHQPRTITMVAALVVALGTFGCAGDTEPKEPTAADDGIEVGAGPADPQDLAAYRDERNVICEAGTAKIDQIKLAIQGGTPDEMAAGYRRIAERIEQAQTDLAELKAPGDLSAFVTADEQLRARRLAATKALADALERRDQQEVRALEDELKALNVETETGEQANEFEHCP